MSYEFDGTDAPWAFCELVNDDDHMRPSVEGRNGEEVCIIDGDDYTAECDARAIAAVPELIWALNRVARLNPNAGEIGEGMLRTIVEDARAALAKATGENQ